MRVGEAPLSIHLGTCSIPVPTEGNSRHLHLRGAGMPVPRCPGPDSSCQNPLNGAQLTLPRGWKWGGALAGGDRATAVSNVCEAELSNRTQEPWLQGQNSRVPSPPAVPSGKQHH